jgi:glycerol-3-phosphate acyltransferase PlsX
VAFANAIGIARTEIIEKVPQRIHKQLEQLLAQRQKA